MRAHRDRQALGWTICTIVGLLALAALIGCSKSPPLGPAAEGGSALAGAADPFLASGFGSGSFYPLEVGKHWSYEGEAELTIVGADGSPGGGGLDVAYTESHALLGTETRDGRVYTVREEVRNELTGPDPGTSTTWSRMRQDRTGLYAANLNSSEPPALDGAATVATAASAGRAALDLSSLRARGFSDESIARFAARIERLQAYARGMGRLRSARAADSQDELTWLLYPLRPGEAWNMVPGMDWPARVDRLEILETPAGRIQAYRIETNPLGEPMREGEFVRLWYGRVGYVGYAIHTSFAATDPEGNPTGDTAIFDDRMLLAATD